MVVPFLISPLSLIHIFLDIQYAESNAEKALNIMENFLQNFDRIDAVLCVGDEMAMAAQRAAAQAGRDEIMFMGFDGISSGVQAVIDGQLTATVAQSPYNMGYQAVVNAVAADKGEEDVYKRQAQRDPACPPFWLR